ncbi:alpha/beta hydrolase domain-containing protein [Arenimonas sp.]|uniref:alpha/beta hydrolase domain-containing protein n=1 Tax=Arenimonas sp. TaxID=1872635 RepID=UPI0025C6660B|nr:alpha/beta hydrolase domain-containing protein [Arenimonas sp.]
MSNLRAVDIYPFADVATPDIDGRGKEGLLDRATRDGTVPRIFYILSSSEYWARAASLSQTTADGSRAVALGPQSRLYFLSGTPHAPRRAGIFADAATQAAYPYNDNQDLSDAINALLENLRLWAIHDVLPPDSVAPMPGSTLVAAKDIRFPAIPGVRVPAEPPPVWQIDLGRAFRTKGILREPVRTGARYPLLVPDVDEDGNELGGWRGTQSSVPLGTYTAWNWQAPELASFGFISGLTGGFIPFARTRAERLAAQDPRLSIEERYGSREGFMRAAAAAVDHAVSQRFLLPMQRDAALERMSRHWDDVASLDGYLGKCQTTP